MQCTEKRDERNVRIDYQGVSSAYTPSRRARAVVALSPRDEKDARRRVSHLQSSKRNQFRRCGTALAPLSRSNGAQMRTHALHAPPANHLSRWPSLSVVSEAARSSASAA